MKRWIWLASALYPRSWREQYGAEFDALLDDVKPRWRVFADVLGGAIKMQMKNRTSWMKPMAAAAALGAIISGWVSFRVPPRFESSAVISVTPQADPLRPTSPQVLRQRALQRFRESESRILSRQSLAAIINDPLLDLYKAERRRRPLEDVEDEMRRNIHIQAVRSANDGAVVFRVSFSYPDQAKAQATVRALTARLTEENRIMTRDSANTYKDLWKDLAAAHLANSVPAPPPGDVIGVLDAPSTPKDSIGPDHIAFVAWGVSAGVLLGLLAALAISYPTGARRLAGFALMGCILAAAASFPIPNRFTATAVMEVVPAVVTEDPLAPPPPATSAAEFLRLMEPLVTKNLWTLIGDPRLNLYAGVRGTKPIEVVARDMFERDIRITPLDPASGAFRISFSYPDRKKAMDTVNALISVFIRETNMGQRANVERMSVIQREIYSRRAFEYVDVLDAPTVPQRPESPNRLIIAAAGLGAGLLIGAITLWIRRPGAPTLQPA